MPSNVTEELLAACRRGDPRAFEEVVRATHAKVYTQALRLVGDRHEAEDVAQDAYLRVFRGLPAFRGDAEFDTWLYRIVANAAISHLRRRRRAPEVSVEVLDDRPRPGETVGLSETSVDRDALERALAGLPSSLRVAVVLKDVYGLSCREIGRRVRTSEGAVKVRLHRARKRLREALVEAEPVREHVDDDV